MTDSDDNKSKFNISVGRDVKGDVHMADGDMHINKSVNVDKSKHDDHSTHEEVRGDKITVGDMNNVTGAAIGRGAQAHVTTGPDAQAFTAMLEALTNLQQQRPDIPAQTIADAQEEVKEIQEKVESGKVDEPWLERKFRALALMGDDILDVITATALNPLMGAATIVRKVAQKAREEAGLD